MPLSFAEFRRANIARERYFKSGQNPAVPWTPADWMTALIGELGEAANIMKKARREDFTLDEVRVSIADELADAQVYLDKLALSLNIDLEQAVIRKFNITSERQNCPIRL